MDQLLDRFSSLSLGWQIIVPILMAMFVALFAIVFWMAGALANDERVTFKGSMLYGPIHFFVLLGAGVGVFSMLTGTSDTREWMKGSNLLPGGGIVLGIDLVLTLILVLAVIRATFSEGLFVWFIRLPLLGLLAALTAGVVFVCMAIDQAAREPDGRSVLMIIGWIMVGVVALGITLFFVTRTSGPTVVRRT